ncbi:hypothetical protein H6F88_27040 [Oculatella sp. FACHB-28]|uniref:hypothetical protein n=1 Tax=Oculatella sp. FACHB-28 TaxID=2692845 RepID=UPI001684B5CD|nr:hypothetical protein [Oculatella sp. FACHB-28]MBD2059608.1 hypothetical protein [Oculatella sp. FACHB-28]
MAKRPHDLDSASEERQKHQPVPPKRSGGQERGDRASHPVKVNVLVSNQKRLTQGTLSAQNGQSTEPTSSTPTPPAKVPVKVNVLVSAQSKKSSKKAQSPRKAEPEWLEEEELDEELEDEAGRLAINVLVTPKPKRGSRIKSALLVSFVLLGMAGTVVGGGWLAVQLIINPGSVRWLSWMMPEWNRHALQREVIQTLAEIEAEATEAGRSLGTPLYLPATVGLPQDLLIPILAESDHCGGRGAITSVPSGCGRLVEVRIYRPLSAREGARPGSFQLMSRMSVSGPEEFFVLDPFVTSPTAVPGSNRMMPLSTVTLIEGNATEPGIWLHLSGERMRGSTRIVYGQVVRYDPAIPQLYSLVEWTSPAGKLPTWQQITGSEATELVVNQTVGLEPSFKVYQVERLQSSTEPIRLTPILLEQAALDSRTYENGLTLARSGLWSAALQTLESLKQQIDAASWSAPAQAQLDLIALHANATKAQAERDWASPSQQILAQLIDGRWGNALQLLQTTIRNGYDLSSLLEVDSDRIWRRVNAALQVNRNQPDVQIWGALVLTAQRDRTAAIAWLRQQNPSPDTNTRVQQVLNLVNPQSAPTLTASHDSRMIGSATQVSSINAVDWLRPQANSPLTLTGQQVWYQIQLANFHDGQRWRRSPFSDLNLPSTGAAQRLWSLLGLTNNSPIQILVWSADGQPQTIEATVKAARVSGGNLQLLAAGSPPSNANSSAGQALSPLAITLSTVSWLETGNLLTLNELSQQQPDGGSALLTNLWQELQRAGQVQATDLEDPDLLQEVGQWSVELIDLTGDGQLESVFTFKPSLLAASSYVTASAQAADQNETRTLIFSAQGQLIYSELSTDAAQFLVAIANPGDGTTALLVANGQTYRLQRWSAQNQRFE